MNHKLHTINLILFLFLLNLVTLGQQNNNVVIKSTNLEIPDSIYPPEDFTLTDFTEWTKTHYPERIKTFKANPLEIGDIVFIGNSITELGKDWGKRFKSTKIKNRGISGDLTLGVLARLDEICYFKAKAVFLLIGINDIFKNKTPGYVVGNICKIVNYIHQNSPLTDIYVQTILPISKEIRKATIVETNKLLSEYTSQNEYK